MLPRGQERNPEELQTAVVLKTSADETLWSQFGVFPDAVLLCGAQNRDFNPGNVNKQTDENKKDAE